MFYSDSFSEVVSAMICKSIFSTLLLVVLINNRSVCGYRRDAEEPFLNLARSVIRLVSTTCNKYFEILNYNKYVHIFFIRINKIIRGIYFGHVERDACF